jgi:transcriptional regulator with XRE-family HTH domain
MANVQRTKAKTSTDKRRQSGPSTLLEEVGALIRKTRKAAGLSQDKLAYAIPLDRAHIGMIENGKRAATIPTLAKLAVALGCEVGDFFPPKARLAEALAVTKDAAV